MLELLQPARLEVGLGERWTECELRELGFLLLNLKKARFGLFEQIGSVANLSCEVSSVDHSWQSIERRTHICFYRTRSIPIHGDVVFGQVYR